MTTDRFPPRRRARFDRCGNHGHPGVTYNPLHDETWCLCGSNVYAGWAETVGQHLACCDGPLTEVIDD